MPVIRDSATAPTPQEALEPADRKGEPGREPRTLSRRALLTSVAAGIALGRNQPAASAPRGPRAIAEKGYVPIGGIDQWIGISGADSANPVILYVHGPGEAQSPLLSLFAIWTDDFTVVNGDQRGSGRTYGRNGPTTPGMATPTEALDQLVDDAHDVAQYVCQRLSKKKIILVGQQWGAALGLHVVKRWPDLFCAFVATGFIPSVKEGVESQERWVRTQATAAGDKKTLAALDATATLPLTDLNRTKAREAYTLSGTDLVHVKLQTALITEAMGEDHLMDWFAGTSFSIGRLLPLLQSFDARQLGLDIPVPFFVIQGRDDHGAPPESVKAYVDEVHASPKALITISGGRYACFTSAAEFVAALRSNVLPLARRAG